MYNVTPILTCDQRLWWKAQQSQQRNNDLRNIVLHLGYLHTEMCFAGSIGHLTGDTGLQELLELVYAKNSVCHMLSGKAINRVVHGHDLDDAALNTILIADS